MSIRIPTRDPRLTRKAVDETKVKSLGTLGPDEYVIFENREYRIGVQPVSGIEDFAPRSGEIFLRRQVVELVDRTPMERSVFRRGSEVERGSYDALAAAWARKTERKARSQRPRPVDVLGMLAPLRAQPEQFLPGRSADTATSGAMRALADLPASGSYVPPVASPTGPAAILAMLRRRGVELTIIPSGRLLVQSPKGHLTSDLLAVIRESERLLVGELTGHPVLCELDHGKGTTPEAETIVAVGIAACEAHAEGRLS